MVTEVLINFSENREYDRHINQSFSTMLLKKTIHILNIRGFLH